MKTVKKYFLTITSIMLFFSCSKDDNPVAENPIVINNSTIYAIGNTYSNNKYTIKLYNNGVVTPITNGTKDAVGRAIFVSGNDVYIGGQEFEDLKYVAKVWKIALLSKMLKPLLKKHIFIRLSKLKN